MKIICRGVGFLLVLWAVAVSAQSPFVHPGALHTQADLDRMAAQVAADASPWIGSWNILIANSHSSLNWHPRLRCARVRDFDLHAAASGLAVYREFGAATALA